MTYNFKQALELMKEGKTLISEESGIVYTLEARGLISYGDIIDPSEVSSIEANGNWYEIHPNKHHRKNPRIDAKEKDELIRGYIKTLQEMGS